MLKRIGIPVIALAAMLTLFGPHQASAATRFGVYVGPSYPVYQPYAYPYGYGYYPYGYYPYATYPPGYSFSFGWHRRHHEGWEHRRHELSEHGRGWRR